MLLTGSDEYLAVGEALPASMAATLAEGLMPPVRSPEREDVDASPPSTSSALGMRNPALDGMRAVGMTCVMIYHAQLGLFPGAFLALSQFFTLSGFLITTVLLRGRHRRGVDLRSFWTGRIRRLTPAALTCLAGVVVFGATIATRAQLDRLPGQVAASATNVVNWYFIAENQSYVDLFADPSPVHHFWSLAVEEQFYLILSVGLFLLLKTAPRLRTLAALFASGAVASTLWMAHLYRGGATLDRIYLGTDTRIAEMLVGALVAVVLIRWGTDYSERTRRLLGLASTVAFVVTVWAWIEVPLADGPIWEGGMLAFACVTVVLILGLLVDRGPVALFMRQRPVAGFGRITYGVYLYHWPIFLWLTAERTGLDRWPLFGLRFLVTTAAAVVSYRLIEVPIRRHGLRGPRSLRLAAAPVAMAVVIAASLLVVNREAADPFVTFREEDASLQAPVVADDGSLDVLAISDRQGEEIVDRMEEVGLPGQDLTIARSPFGCDHLVAADGADPTCASWREDWPDLIEEHNPDVVLFFVEDWDAEELAALGEPSGTPPQQVAASALAQGFDMLSARGAPILFAQPGASFGVALGRSFRPFNQAMADLSATRDDIRLVLGGRLPDREATAHEEYVDGSAAALLSDLSLYQRADRDRLDRVMIVGDSQARSLGYGLERWAAENDRAVVWNTAVPGCGVVGGGTVPEFGGEQPVSETCRDGLQAWEGHVASFRPDLVVVLAGSLDAADRRPPGGDAVLEVGDPALQRYLRQELQKAVDTLTAEGAHLLWMTAPCLDFDPASGNATSGVEGDQQALVDLNRSVIEPVVDANSDDVSLFDLDAVVCPGGRAMSELPDGAKVRSDGVHFSTDGSQWFAETYGDEVLETSR